VENMPWYQAGKIIIDLSQMEGSLAGKKSEDEQ
jgi:hypothetical protein